MCVCVCACSVHFVCEQFLQFLKKSVNIAQIVGGENVGIWRIHAKDQTLRKLELDFLLVWVPLDGSAKVNSHTKHALKLQIAGKIPSQKAQGGGVKRTVSFNRG